VTIVIAGSIVLDPKRRAEALAAGLPFVQGAREQPGCTSYVWCADPHEDTLVWVYERWDTEAALAAHLAGPWYRGMLGVIGAHGLVSADVLKFRVDLEEPVYDDAGIPRADFFTAVP
jgi:quinol monooxygenase YgiN